MAKQHRLALEFINDMLARAERDGSVALVEWLQDSVKPKKAGRPREWSSRHIMHMWLAIELEKYRLKTSVQAAVTSMLRSRKRHVHVGEKDEYTINSASRARELHTKAKKLMKHDARLAQEWMQTLKYAKRCIDEGRRAKIVGNKIRITRRANTPAGRAGENL